MYAYSGETTEWEDILIKKGITTKTEVLLSKGLDPNDVRNAWRLHQHVFEDDVVTV